MTRLRLLSVTELANRRLERQPLTIRISCAYLTGLLLLSGCSAMKVKMGMRVDLTQTPVSSIEISLPQGPAIAPVKKSALVAKVTQPDGTILLTEGQGGGKVQWKDLAVKPEIVTASNKGVLSAPKDPRVTDAKTGHVTVTVPSHPDVKAAELDVPFRYDSEFTARFNGADGSRGFDGQSGSDGMMGSPGSLDPNNPSPGGNGGDGTDGRDGDNGKPGPDGPAVQVLLTIHPGSPTLLEAKVSAGAKQKLYLIDPKGGSLTVIANGGNGGSAGAGGRGGRGGSGGIGTPNGSSGHDGLSGHDGFSGADGRGGQITMTYDPAAKAYLNTIKLTSRNGPASVLRESPVAPLW
ncbi:MAG TPA: hypothetical protein VGF20_07880 [Candidatus Acidoferrum sp.]|jgi:hypothetical protein